MSKQQIKNTEALAKIKEDSQEDIDYFYGATTLPDRAGGVNKSGERYDGEILSVEALHNIADMINDTNKLGGDIGSYRTISLFHDRVYERDPTKEEAGYIKPLAIVEPLKKFPGHFGLKVPTTQNKFYKPSTNFPDYTPDKIRYKIDNDAIGLSLEYNNTKDQEKIVTIGDHKYNFISEITDYRGFGYARANLIGNPTTIKIKEVGHFLENTKGDINMSDEDTKKKEAEMEKLRLEHEESVAKVKELTDEIAKLKDAGESVKVKEMEKKQQEVEAKVKELELKRDESATKIKESIERAFANIQFKAPAMNNESKSDAKVKEAYNAISKDKKDWTSFRVHAQAKFKETNYDKYLAAKLKEGFDLEGSQTVEVVCDGRSMLVVPTSKTKEVYEMEIAKTKDVLDATAMATTYTQTNAMFADMYAQGITETFLKDDTLLKALNKIQHAPGNDYYQWKIWTEFIDSSTESLAVDPNNTSVARNFSNFIKLQTPIKEYRDGVEVTDFTQHHSTAAVGNLMGIELQRAAERVTQSMAADIYKENADGDSFQFLGLEAVADSAGNTTLYGLTRSTTNRLAPDAAGDTLDSTSEAIGPDHVRDGYESVLSRGSNMGDIAIVMNPAQFTKLRNVEEAKTDYVIMDKEVGQRFGFNRGVMPVFDGIFPIILDYNCQSDAFYVINVGVERGFNLVVSRPLGARGLAKVGLSESAYVNFWGCTVYKSPRDIFLHDALT